MGKFKVGDVVVRVQDTTQGLFPVGSTEGVREVTADGGMIKTTRMLGWWNSEDFKLAPCVGVGSTNTKDLVDSPAHYAFFPDLEAIQVIARAMTQEQFYGYCLGNRLKYRLRAGKKDALEQDIAKSDKYTELYEQHKHLCHS